MSDLLHRLKFYRVSAHPDHPVHPAICDEAAERIEQLQKSELEAKKKLREAEERCDKVYRDIEAILTRQEEARDIESAKIREAIARGSFFELHTA